MTWKHMTYHGMKRLHAESPPKNLLPAKFSSYKSYESGYVHF